MSKETENKPLDNLPSVEFTQENYPYVPPSGGLGDMLMDSKLFELGQRAAKLFAASDMVPDKYHGSVANCFIAIHLARNLDIDPFMFMKNCYFVRGTPELQGQLVIALINSRGPYIDGVHFTEKGTKGSDNYSVTAWGTRPNGEKDSCTLDIAKVKELGWWNKNPLWKQMPEQFLKYRTATWLGRAHCPEVLMGLRTSGEVLDSEPGAVTVMPTQELNEALGLKKPKVNSEGEPINLSIFKEDEYELGKSSSKVSRSEIDP